MKLVKATSRESDGIAALSMSAGAFGGLYGPDQQCRRHGETRSYAGATDADYDAVMDLNARGGDRNTGRDPHMKAGGFIINTTSIAARERQRDAGPLQLVQGVRLNVTRGMSKNSSEFLASARCGSTRRDSHAVSGPCPARPKADPPRRSAGPHWIYRRLHRLSSLASKPSGYVIGGGDRGQWRAAMHDGRHALRA
ncbi:MAG: hypothetical protein H6892_09410 [Brucellaceae bacterium]|nr:hypothetical protein [Brucellaceae bacterium]